MEELEIPCSTSKLIKLLSVLRFLWNLPVVSTSDRLTATIIRQDTSAIQWTHGNRLPPWGRGAKLTFYKITQHKRILRHRGWPYAMPYAIYHTLLHGGTRVVGNNRVQGGRLLQ